MALPLISACLRFENQETTFCTSLMLRQVKACIKQNLENFHFYYKHKMLAKLNLCTNTPCCIPVTD